MYLQIIAITDTHHNDMDTPKYVYVQVPSGYLFH
jgi:hypothetical protein